MERGVWSAKRGARFALRALREKRLPIRVAPFMMHNVQSDSYETTTRERTIHLLHEYIYGQA